MNKISRILLVAVIIISLIVGVAAAGGSKKTVEVKDRDHNYVRNKDVTIDHGSDRSTCRTGDDGKCEIEDSGRDEEIGSYRDSDGSDKICTVKASLSITKSASPTTYTAAGQTIYYTYVINNTGTAILRPPFNVSDNKTTVICPQPSGLGPGTNITCTGIYVVTLDDLTNGSITNTANATALNNTKTVYSKKVNATVTRQSGGQIPEFPSIALPIAATLGLLFVMRRKI